MQSSQSLCHSMRRLTPEEEGKLKQDTKLVTAFKKQKLEREAQKNWDLFYKRNMTKFFKDRHWTTREFVELCEKRDKNEKLAVLEAGCGVGNFLFPLLEEDKNLFFYACDFSPRAVQFVKEHPQYDPTRCQAFQADLTSDSLLDTMPENAVDIVSMIFVLSAINPDKMLMTLQNVYQVLKPGGIVLFRDYGLYDHAMLRFAPGHKLSENFYVRQDGTRAYYFSTEKLNELFMEAGFETKSNQYITRETVNRKEGLCVARIFVQGQFIKKSSCSNRTGHFDQGLDPCDNIKGHEQVPQQSDTVTNTNNLSSDETCQAQNIPNK